MNGFRVPGVRQADGWDPAVLMCCPCLCGMTGSRCGKAGGRAQCQSSWKKLKTTAFLETGGITEHGRASKQEGERERKRWREGIREHIWWGGKATARKTGSRSFLCAEVKGTKRSTQWRWKPMGASGSTNNTPGGKKHPAFLKPCHYTMVSVAASVKAHVCRSIKALQIALNYKLRNIKLVWFSRQITVGFLRSGPKTAWQADKVA